MPPSNKRRRSSFDHTSNPSSNKFAAVEKPPTLISLPSPVLSAASFTKPIMQKRRSPLTPPSVTPASVTVSDHTTHQRDSDRCRSPSQRASTLLAKVAIVSAQQPVPSEPKYWAVSSPTSSLTSLDNTPTATPPEGGPHFMFGSRKELPSSPEGEYVSFPVFEAFMGYKSDEDEDEHLAARSPRQFS